MPRTAPPPVLRDRQVAVETPEHVAIGYELADLGTRFTAFLIDALLLVAAGIALLVLSLLLGHLAGRIAAILEGAGAAVGALAFFVVSWGYFVYFEGLRDGRTPGKRRVHIRVVHDGGYPVTLRGAAVRNLLRLVDIQPAPSWLVAGVSMMVHSQTKRLGDLAAGTVVVRDRAGDPIPEESAPPAGAALGPPRLSDEEFRALALYVSRREGLQREVRAGLARKLAGRLEERLGETARQRRRGPDGFLVVVHAEEAARRRAAGAGSRAGSALATALVRRQRERWEEYRSLLEEARRRGLERLGEARVSRFAALYREVAADLARTRTYGGSPELLYALERSVGAGHNLLYRPEARSWRRFAAWLGGGFPALVRRLRRPVLLATALFYLPALLSFVAVRLDPPLERQLLPATMIARAEEATAKEARGEGYADIPQVLMPVMASGLISNNVQVTFLAFAGGILAGVGTVWVLLTNGVMLGASAGAFANRGASLHLWSFVLPHGVIELTAICIAGGAGLWLGSALLLPGRRTRREVLVARGREAVSLIAGTAVLLVAAGLIEAFVSPSHLPRPLKFVLAGCFGAALLAYLLLAGRRSGADAASADVV